jgi:hypothetical protein
VSFSDEMAAIIRQANPAENGPVFKIDRDDPEVIRRLTELKERIIANIPLVNPHEPPEAWFDKVHIQLPPIVDALLGKGIVYLWAIAREAQGAPYILYSFSTSCALIAKVEGVEEIFPAAN